jgi:hypothetical protein
MYMNVLITIGYEVLRNVYQQYIHRPSFVVPVPTTESAALDIYQQRLERIHQYKHQQTMQNDIQEDQTREKSSAETLEKLVLSLL